MVPYVPPEIVLNVLSFVTGPDRKETLLSCAPVCREWRPLAQTTLLCRVDFRDEPKVGRSEAVKGLAAAARRETGGWRCDEFDTSELDFYQLFKVLEAATAVKSLYLNTECVEEEDEVLCASFDWFALDCMSKLKDLCFAVAAIPPTRFMLLSLRALTFYHACEADGALPSIIAAAPNLKRLDIQLDSDTSSVLAKCDSSLLTGLQHLFLDVMSINLLKPAPFEVVLKFVADCSANLKSVNLNFFDPTQHSALLRAITSHLDEIYMTILIKDSDEFSSVGARLKETALLKVTERVKKWDVDLTFGPPANEQSRSRAGPLVQGAWENDNWLEWVAMCDGRGVQLQVTSDVDRYNAKHFPQTSGATA